MINTEENIAKLNSLIEHREALRGQIKGNFGKYKMSTIFMDVDFKYDGFKFFIIDLFIEWDPNKEITFNFSHRKYSIGFSFIRRKGEGGYSIWLSLDASFNIENSRKFIELCYRFLNNYETIFLKRKWVKEPEKISERWNKMKNEISLSI